MVLNTKLWKYSLPLFLVLILISNWYHSVRGPKLARDIHFRGPVTKVYYDQRHHPYITIKGKERNLDWMIWDRYCTINVGDTIIKSKGDLKVKLIKRNSKDTISFTEAH